MPWLIGMTYKAVRTEGYKHSHWVNRGASGELDELYHLEEDQFEMANVVADPAYRDVRNAAKRSDAAK